MMGPDEIRERLDLTHIDQAAHWAWKRLVGGSEVAVVHLTPGDHTVYKIAVMLPEVHWADVDERIARQEFIVSLINCSGVSYPWSAEFDMHPDYVAGHWTTDDRLWTGVVLAEFLNRLADLLRAPTKED